MISINLVIAVALCALPTYGCVSAGTGVLEQLDESTGTTLTSTTTPVVLYRDTPSRAAFARDFLHVGPIAVNKMGQYRYYLWLGGWSTNQEEHLSAQMNGFESIVIFADGEPMQVDVSGWTPESVGANQSLYARPVSSMFDAYYEITIDQLRFMAQASDLRVRTTGSQAASYELWDSQGNWREGFEQFLGALNY